MCCPCGRAMGCLLWGSCSDVVHKWEIELTGGTPCIALAGEPWGVCCEDPGVIYGLKQFNKLILSDINQNLNSQGTPHVLFLQVSHGVSVIHQLEFELTGVTPCIALTDEPWGVCCEDPAVTKYINQIFNSQMMPHVSPWRMSHGVSVVMILEKMNYVMAAPHFVNKNCRGSLETHGAILCDFCLSSSGIVTIDHCVVYCLCVVLDNKIKIPDY